MSFGSAAASSARTSAAFSHLDFLRCSATSSLSFRMSTWGFFAIQAFLTLSGECCRDCSRHLSPHRRCRPRRGRPPPPGGARPSPPPRTAVLARRQPAPALFPPSAPRLLTSPRERYPPSPRRLPPATRP